MMRRELVGLAAIALSAVLGCGQQAPAGAASGGPSATTQATEATSAAAAAIDDGGAHARSARHEGSPVAFSQSEDAIYLADEDHSTIHAIATPIAKNKPVTMQAPGRPAQIVALGDRLLVTIRQIGDGDGALLVLKRKSPVDLEEAARVAVPADAWGVTVTPDEKIALVSSAWAHKITAVDLASQKTIWSIDVAREPRGIVFLPSGDRAYVTHVVGSDVTRLDGPFDKEPKVTRVALPASPVRSPANEKLQASGGYAAIASPDGARVYFPRVALGALGPDAWFGQGAVDVLLTGDDSPAAPARSARPEAAIISMMDDAAQSMPWLEGLGPTIDRPSPVVEPHAIAYRKKTDTILVVNEGDDRVVELDARAMDPAIANVRSYYVGIGTRPDLSIAEGGAPVGIAVSAREDKAYVYCRANDELTEITLGVDDGAWDYAPSKTNVVHLADDDKQLAIGRTLFHLASNSRLSGGMSCNGCHPEGRDDGHVWHESKIELERDHAKFTVFLAGTDTSALEAKWGKLDVEGKEGVGYARQTPMLAGRVKAQGPYGWHGESKDLTARMRAGFELHRWGTTEVDTIAGLYEPYLVSYLRDGLVPPPRAKHELTEQEQQGKKIFESPATQCATCHVPDSGFTDRQVVPMKQLSPPRGFSEDPNHAYKTPSLLYVGGSAPYFHDGRFESLESLFEYNQDRMGKTSQLSADDKKALIAYLRTL